MGNQEHVHKLGYRTNQDIQKSNLNLEPLTGHPNKIIILDMNNENDDFKQIDRKVVTEATILDMELDMCHDPSEYNVLH